MKMLTTLRLTILFFSLILSYCKGNNSLQLSKGTPDILAAPGATRVAGTISAETGGHIMLQNMTLSIPAGALEQDTEISAAVTPVDAPAFDGATKIGRGIKFLPEGLQFLKPIEVEFCYSGTEVSAGNLNEKSMLVYYAEENGDLVGMSGAVDSGRHCVIGHIEHFSVYIPAAQLLSAGNTQPNVTGANFLPSATTLMVGLPARMRVTITDFNGGSTPGTIVSAFLIYCRMGDLTCSMNPATATNKVALQPDNTDPAVANRYYATIPESFITLAGLRYRFQATDQVGVTRTTGIANRSISRTASALRFNPSTAFNISAGFMRDLTLQAFDGTAWRNISADNFSVSGGIGTVTRSGPSSVRLAAITTGAGSVNATSGTFTTSVNVNVLTGMLTNFELMDNNQVIITNPINIGAGSSYTFDALGYDAYGNTAVINPQFTVQGGVGSVNAAAVFTASATAPLTGTVTATIGGISDIVNVNVWTQPVVVSTAPADGATDVNINASISVTFSEPMATTTLTTSTTSACTGSLNISLDNFVTCVPMTGAVPVFSGGDSIVTIQPFAPLAIGSTYRIRINATVSSVNGVLLTAPYAPAGGFSTVAPMPSGSLDISFGVSGIVTTSLTDRHLDLVAVGLQSDGKLVVVSGGFGFSLLRYNTDGSLDASFGNAGLVDGFGYGYGNPTANALRIQNDGKILVAGNLFHGSFNAQYDYYLARFNPDGTRDMAFGVNGQVITPVGADYDFINAIDIQGDGRIVAAGTSIIAGRYQFSLARYAVNGTLDPTFGSGGVVTTSIAGLSDTSTAVGIQSDGKIVAGGLSVLSGGSSHRFALVRYLLDGSIDSTFGIGGIVTTDFGTSYNSIAGLNILSDGRIIAMGPIVNSGQYRFGLVRYLGDGSLDTSFDTDGVAIGLAGSPRACAVQANGKVLIAGYTLNGSGYQVFTVARHNTDGSIDTSFGAGGAVISDLAPGYHSEAFALALQADGRIVAAGRAQSSSYDVGQLIRYWP